MVFPATPCFYMDKQLHELTKEELISVVQDYQEMVSEIEEVLNSHNESEHGLHLCKYKIRDILAKYL